ncbi:MAG TPA: Asp-tRNA(Asn)/Glu-tRNA(Gln) amidotransferase subunit GatA [Candidatus Blautia intestinipullorum]|nr:Asp-tRNA(Asn)/Glu-tRNA(Gln) amidotransferase subunit GatA [Candidatus Blautia intestinipullorum]
MDLEKMTALELAEKIKQRQISVLDGVKTVFAAIEKKENRIHAYLDIYKKEAYARARQVEKGIAEGIYTGPLAGVPIAVKDNICVKGKKTTCASRMLENFVPSYQAEAVSRLEQAGMIVIGKTNMDEFAMGSTTETSAYGVTRNPWNTDHVPGGSSGGSCAAVAAGEAYLALGSDTGGSIRQPSSFCGVTGVKPTYGTVSRYGLVAYASSLDQIGPIGKNTADCAALLEVIAGRDPKDSTSLDRKDLDFSGAMDQKITGMKFGIPKEYLAKGLDGEVKNSFMEALKILTGQGAIVEFFSVSTMEYMIPAYYIIASAEASSNLERFDGVKYGYRAADYEGLHDMYYKTRTEGFGEEVKRRIMLGSFVLSSGYYDAYYLKALRAKALIRQEFDRAFEKYDVILAPAAPHTAPRIGESLKDPLAMYLGDIYTVAVNLCGLPAISVPCGVDSKGLPIGIQMIGNRFEEKKIFRSAAAFERGGRD